ncbi:zf-HC2 domain-containing protein [Candidatus Sumerlaeota bacterium]|nr:zf-HC2 domain-containing protein [Candidatus Sumerlaeota bacterium]
MMNCDNFEKMILDYLDGELSPEETEVLMKHLAECKACADLLSQYQNQEKLLVTYYDCLLKTALGAPKPKIEAPKRNVTAYRLAYHLYAAAAVFGLILLSGLSLFIYHLITQSGQGQVVGTATRVIGRVQYFEDDQLLPVTEGMEITSRMRFKTINKAYLSVEIEKPSQGKGSNLVEFRENTVASFHDFRKRTELALERGEVWVHLNQKPAKAFSVKTKHGSVYDKGTIYNVTQGMTGIFVGVVTGEVYVEQKGEEIRVKRGEAYTSFSNDSGDTVRNHVPWSHYREKLLALLGTEPEERLVAKDLRNLLQVREYRKTGEPLALPGGEDIGALDTAELLPVDTWFFFEVASMPDTIREWNSSDYSRLFQDPALLEWWQSNQMQDVRKKVNDTLAIPAWLDLLHSVTGSFSMSITGSGGFIIVADCRKNPETTRTILEERIDPILKIYRNKYGSLYDLPKVQISRGYLVFGWNNKVIENTLNAIKEDKPTGFTSTRFYQNLRDNVPSSRMMVAYDFRSTIDATKARGDANLNKFLEWTGFDGLDYILGSPDFSGRGINQAFRVAFTGARRGMMSWLDEPAPMGSLRYFSPDVHLMAAARIKSPELMFKDVLNWIFEGSGSSLTQEEDRLLQWLQDFSSCFGNEVAIGLQNPVLPIPNIQVVIEVLDPIRFHDLMLEWIGILDEHTDTKLTIEAKEYREKLIVTIDIPERPFDISYVVLEDYLVIGPGEPFLRHAVDVFLENHSIVDEYDFNSLLPASGQLNFSFFNYYNIGKAMPDLITNFSRRNFTQRQQSMVPDVKVVERFQSAGIGYAYSSDQYIDFYINGSMGVDFNFGGALPLIANLVSSAVFDEYDSRFVRAQDNLKSTQAALEAYHVDNNRYPDILAELVSPVAYLTSVPTDPLSGNGSMKLQYYVIEGKDACVLYSAGPDGVDDSGIVVYDPTNGTNSKGDLVLKCGNWD